MPAQIAGNVPRLTLSTGWPPSIGIGGRFPSDWVAAFRRNHWPPCPGIRSVAAGGLYWAFFRTDVVEDTKPPIALIAGWDELGACSNMASLDGARELKFFENQNAEMWDHSSLKEGESDIAQGVWSYDAATKRYALTLKGETTTYTFLSRGDPVTCILYKGHLDSADLRASWFSFPTSEESPD